VGISFVATMLERFSQAHQAFMTAGVSSLSPIYQQKLAVLQSALQSHFSPAGAEARAQAMIYNIVQQQTGYWAFVELFYWFMLLGIVCALGVWLLKSVQPGRAIAAH